MKKKLKFMMGGYLQDSRTGACIRPLGLDIGASIRSLGLETGAFIRTLFLKYLLGNRNWRTFSQV